MNGHDPVDCLQLDDEPFTDEKVHHVLANLLSLVDDRYGDLAREGDASASKLDCQCPFVH